MESYERTHRAKRSLLHLMYLFNLKSGTHVKSITVNDLRLMMSRAFSNMGTSADNIFMSPSQLKSLKETFGSVKSP